MALTGEQIRWILIASVFGVALLACLFFVWKGKKKDGALVMLCGSLLVAFFVLSDFTSVAEYGSGSLAPVGEGEIAVTIEIDASLAGEGYLLASREVALVPGESVLELLLRVTQAASAWNTPGATWRASQIYTSLTAAINPAGCTPSTGMREAFPPPSIFPKAAT